MLALLPVAPVQWPQPFSPGRRPGLDIAPNSTDDAAGGRCKAPLRLEQHAAVALASYPAWQCDTRQPAPDTDALLLTSLAVESAAIASSTRAAPPDPAPDRD